jgi:integrase
VFRYAVATARAKADPAGLLLGAVAAPQPRHLSAIVEPKRVGELLRAIDGYSGLPVTRLALALSPHVFVRPGELRQAEWSEIDIDAAVWRIPAARMKKRREHVVPLSTAGARDPERAARAHRGMGGLFSRRSASLISHCRKTPSQARYVAWVSERPK